MEQLKNLFPKIINRLKFKKDYKKKTIFSLWEEIVFNVCGYKFGMKSQPVDFKNNILFVECLNSLWANEFKMKQEDLLEYLNKKLDSKNLGKIHKIRFFY